MAESRLSGATAATQSERQVIVDEMKDVLDKHGSLYTWCELQFWRLRFAGGGTTTPNFQRLIVQNNKLKGYVTSDKLIKPVRDTPEGTKAEREAEKNYSYESVYYSRLSAALHDAYAYLDTYLNQMGVAHRPANSVELTVFTPGLDPETKDELSARGMEDAQHGVLPPTVLPDFDKIVEPMLLHPGAYDRDCLKMRPDPSGGKYSFPTLVDHSVINDFLRGEHGKLATWRKGVRWALMSSTRLREP
eukprot:7124358-Heterocapsa_arctica.AAC.1